MAFCFRNTNKACNVTGEDEEIFREKNICRFCEEKLISDKVRGHCHLTGKHKGPVHNKRNISVTETKYLYSVCNLQIQNL